MKKFLSAILCITLLLSFPTAYAAACSAKQYPFVFVHGMMGWGEAQGIDSFMPYWGTTSGDVLAYLERRGYETCSASVGGIYDNRMLVKPSKSAVAYMATADRELPYDGAKEMLLVEDVDNREFLNGLFNAMYDDLPAPKKKK